MCVSLLLIRKCLKTMYSLIVFNQCMTEEGTKVDLNISCGINRCNLWQVTVIDGQNWKWPNSKSKQVTGNILVNENNDRKIVPELF